MSLPAEAKSYHTVWVSQAGTPAERAHAVRYAAVDGHLYCFGDDGLRHISDGSRVSASIHRIANGPPLLAFDATVRTVEPADVNREALLELVAHIPLGRDLTQVEHTVDEWARTRRIVELVA
jgi:hypothetical protein